MNEYLVIYEDKDKNQRLELYASYADTLINKIKEEIYNLNSRVGDYFVNSVTKL